MDELNKITATKLTILQAEFSVLATKVNGVIDTLWKIRAAEATLWTATIAAGLGNFTASKTPILSLLLLTCFIPIWFLFVDAKNNQWYRRLSQRERQIQYYINKDTYRLPKTAAAMNLTADIEAGCIQFPVYDLGGEHTFGGDGEFAWQTHFVRSLVDTIPLFVYGTQVIFSSIALGTCLPRTYQMTPIASCLLFALILSIVAMRTKSRCLRGARKILVNKSQA